MVSLDPGLESLGQMGLGGKGHPGWDALSYMTHIPLIATYHRMHFYEVKKNEYLCG